MPRLEVPTTDAYGSSLISSQRQTARYFLKSIHRHNIGCVPSSKYLYIFRNSILVESSCLRAFQIRSVYSPDCPRKCIRLGSLRSSHLPLKMHYVGHVRSSLPCINACRVNSKTLSITKRKARIKELNQWLLS